MKRILLRVTDSTNRYIKRFLKDGENVIVCAERQSQGMGTKGRSFLSEEGGVYFSALLFHEGLAAGDAFRVMAHAAVAACKTAEGFGLSPEIKWCNDILAGGKKLAGILIENILSEGRVKASVVGIGLNVRNRLTGLEEIAVRMQDLLDPCPSAAEVRESLIENFCTHSEFSDYLSRVRFLGKQVLVSEGGRVFPACAKEILEDGRLLISEGGALRALSAAEISVDLHMIPKEGV